MGGPGSGRTAKRKKWKNWNGRTRPALKTFSVEPAQQKMIEQYAEEEGLGDARGAGFAPAGRELIEIGYEAATKKKG